MVQRTENFVRIYNLGRISPDYAFVYPAGLLRQDIIQAIFQESIR